MPLAKAERQRQTTKPGLAVRGTFLPVRAWRPAVVARLARTLGLKFTLMRRTTLKLLASTTLSAAALPAFAARAPKMDTRLLGTWRSDKERTTKLWRYKTELDAEKKAKFESIFGKLTRRYTFSHVYTEFDGDKTSGKYSVIASDERSVVLAYPEENGTRLEQVFFEEDWLYILAGYNVEFFRRVEA